MVQPDLSQPPHIPTALQNTGQTESESLGRVLRLEVVTDGHRIVGVTQRPVIARLLDLLNRTEESALALTDVEVAPLEAQGEASYGWPQAYVYKPAIAFVIPHEEERDAVAIPRRSLEYVEKRPWPVSTLLPRFMVTGYIHLPPAVDPANPSLFWKAGFVALTSATAVFLPDPTTTWKVPVLIVNTARAEAYCPTPALADEQPPQIADAAG
jgi:hypothetical protein